MQGAEMTSPLTSPSISVVIPLFNKRGWVVEAVASALMQDWSPAEVIVVDDGSTDGGAASLTGFDERLRVLRQSNAGVSAARNRGIAEARGDWVAFLDADDRFLQGHFRRLVKLSRTHPEAAVLCCGYRNFWPDGRTQDRVLAGIGHGLVRDFFKAQRRGLTCVGAIAIRRCALAEFDEPFAVGMRYGEDPDCWFRLAERWPVAYVPRIGVEIRKGVDGRVSDSQDFSVLAPCFERLAERVEQGGFPSHLRRSARVLVAGSYLSAATHCAARGNFARSRELIQSREAKADLRLWITAVLRIWAIRLHLKKL
jgi:glycosyltransferase involved in cell wall biosynthesis